MRIVFKPNVPSIILRAETDTETVELDELYRAGVGHLEVSTTEYPMSLEITVLLR